MGRPLYKFKNAKGLPDSLKFRVFEQVRGAYESLDGNVFVVPKKRKVNVFTREGSNEDAVVPATVKKAKA